MIRFLKWLFGIKETKAAGMRLKKYPKLELRFYNRFFRVDNTWFDVEITQEEYKQGLKRTPPEANCVWRLAYGNYYCPIGGWVNEKGIQKLVNIRGQVTPIPNNCMNGDILNLKGIAELQKLKTKFPDVYRNSI